MSSFAKGFGGCLGVFAAICFMFVGGCVFMAFLASNVEIDSSVDVADPDPVAPVVAEQPELPESPKWVFTTLKDDLTDEEMSISSLDSTNTVDLKFPYSGEQRGRLVVRYQGGKQSVMFSIKKGQLFPTSLQLGTGKASIRIDDTLIESPISPTTGVQPEIMFLTDERLPGLIRNGKELRIEVELYQESNQVFVFDLTSGR